jgi:molybdate transport system permease protein
MLHAGPLFLTLKLATITTGILFIVGLPLAYFLAFSSWRIRSWVEAAVNLPLVLPPTVIGFYLLISFSPENALGKFLEEHFNLRLVFSFPGLVVGSLLYSLPFMVQPLQAGFKMLPSSLREASYTLGKSAWTTLWKILLPNMSVSIMTGCILSFAHTVGEFGIVLMLGGNIEGQTRVASIAIYDAVEAMQYHQANVYALILMGVSFIVLLIVYSRGNTRKPNHVL